MRKTHWLTFFLLTAFALCDGICQQDSLVGRVYTDKEWAFRFGGESLGFEIWNRESNVTHTEKYPYGLTSEYGMRYLEYGRGFATRMIVLSSDRMMLLSDGDDRPPYYSGVSTGALSMELYRSPERLESSSTLVENMRVYGPENLRRIDLGQPWVEGAAGLGVGEWISRPYTPVRSGRIRA